MNNQNEKTLDIKVTATEFNTIIAGLEELPHRVSRRIIDNLAQQMQIQMQVNPHSVAPLASKVIL